MSEQQAQQPSEFEIWGILEIMGHRKFGERLTEACIAGVKFIQINFYGLNGEPKGTQFYSPNSIYCITPTSKEVAVAFGVRNPMAPVQAWELEVLSLPVEVVGYEDDEVYEHE